MPFALQLRERTLNIIFAGTPDFAAESLKALLAKNHQVSAVYSQPDRPSGRGKKLLPSPVKQVAIDHDIPVFQPESLKSEDAQRQLSELKPDLMIVAAYGLILPKEVLEIPSLGCINIHASLLPRWRGAAPIQRAIQAGDEETGITIMQMDEGLDTGDMLLKKSCSISTQDNAGTLHDRLAKLGGEAILEYLEQREHLIPTPQNDSEANYASKLSKEEARVDWHQPAGSIARTVRAFNPWPVCFIEWEDSRIRILEANGLSSQNTADKNTQPGTVLKKDREGVDVACKEGVLRITKLQLPGSKAMSVADFVNGGKEILEPGQQL